MLVSRGSALQMQKSNANWRRPGASEEQKMPRVNRPKQHLFGLVSDWILFCQQKENIAKTVAQCSNVIFSGFPLSLSRSKKKNKSPVLTKKKPEPAEPSRPPPAKR